MKGGAVHRVMMSSYIFLALSVSFAVANNVLLHGFRNRGIRGMGDSLLFNAFVSVIWAIIFTVLADFRAITVEAVAYGLCYGVLTAGFLLCKMQAMSLGPVSVATFVGCSSLLVSTAFGVIVDHDYPSALQIVGVVLLLVALFLTVSPKGGEAKKGWRLWCALFLVGGGAVGIIFNLHQRSAAREAISEMMLVASVTAAVLLTVSAFAVSYGKDRTTPRIGKEAIPFLIGCGIVSCAYNRLNVGLVGALPSIVFFPVFNGAVILIASVLSAVLFRERLKGGQYVGLILGAGALLLASGTLG